MRLKKTLLAAAAMAAFAFAALPAIASANIETAPTLDPHKNGQFPVNFTSHSGPGVLYGPLPFSCTSGTNAGKFENEHTGTVVVTFHECGVTLTPTIHIPCTSPGQGSGTIQTNDLTFHTVYLRPDNEQDPHETPGVLFTPDHEGTFATFTCSFIHVVVTGSGVLGDMHEPTIDPVNGTTTDEMTIEVEASAEGQAQTEYVTGGVAEEEHYAEAGLEASVSEEEPVPVYEDAGSDTVTFEDDVILTTETE